MPPGARRGGVVCCDKPLADRDRHACHARDARGAGALLSQFLIHAADVEGLCQGIDEALVTLLGEISPLPCTYAGGGKHIDDLERVGQLSSGRVDLTFGSALDLFGGSGVRYQDCVDHNHGLAGSDR